MKKVFKISYKLLNVLVYSIVFLIAIAIIPRIFGIKSYVVLSGSMTPNIPVGSIIYDKKVNFKDINIGDVITFKTDDSDTGVVTHRVVNIDKDTETLVTKGDANNAPDPKVVSSQDIIGKYKVHIPFLGDFLMKLKESKAYIFIVLFIIISIFI